MTKTRVLIIVLVVATLAAAAFLLPIKDWTIQLAE